MEHADTTRDDELALDDLELADDDAERVVGGSEPTNERPSPLIPGSLNHNEILAVGR